MNKSLPDISKNNGFTAIRIICAPIVVYEHFIILTGINIPFLGIRDIAVNVFFFLSGFWVTRSFYTSKSVIEFFKKRIKKIFPLYLTIVFLSAFLLFFMSTLNVTEYFGNEGFWKYIIANVCTLNFLHPSLPGVFHGEPVNGSLWTIKIEITFYVLLPILLYLCNKQDETKSKWYCLKILLFVYFLSILYVTILSIMMKKYKVPTSLLNQFPAFMGYFVSGMICFFYYYRILKLLNKLIIPCAILFLFCIILHNCYVNIIFEPFSLAIVILWCALKIKPLFIFSRIYDFSYFLYLVHYPIIMIIKELFIV